MPDMLTELPPRGADWFAPDGGRLIAVTGERFVDMARIDFRQYRDATKIPLPLLVHPRGSMARPAGTVLGLSLRGQAESLLGPFVGLLFGHRYQHSFRRISANFESPELYRRRRPRKGPFLPRTGSHPLAWRRATAKRPQGSLWGSRGSWGCRRTAPGPRGR